MTLENKSILQNSRPERSLLITGGAGFIGSHLVHRLAERYPRYQLVVFDKLTYAGDLRNLDGLPLGETVFFVKGDICDPAALAEVMQAYRIDGILHLAAESHVDRSIENSMEFVHTNVIGTVNLLHAALSAWGEHADRRQHLFYHISTDEVYGSL